MDPNENRGAPRLDGATVTTVQAVCAELLERPERLAERFYHHLFRLLPRSRALFPADLGDQRVRMARVLVQTVAHLDDPRRTRGYLRALGGYHYARWGVRPEEYRQVGHALIEAARDLSPAWSPAVGSSWVLVFERISAAMIAGAADAAGQRGAPSAVSPQAGRVRWGGEA